jgi:pimeloyl-ACP methyl ester carboxylesterase
MKEVCQTLRLNPPETWHEDVPLFIYLPGMDGTGELFSHQIGKLGQKANVHCLTIPGDDLQNWDQLTDQVVDLVEKLVSAQPRRLVYLMGESFGGCLAIKTILRSPHLFDRLILSNPASSFQRQPLLFWGSHLVTPQVESIYHWSCSNFVPFLAAVERLEPRDRQLLLQAMKSVSQRSSIWRLGLLRSFNVTDAEYRSITQPTLLIASARDRLLPSFAEAERLARLLPTARVQVLPKSGHACLLERDVDLLEIMTVNGFLDGIESPPESHSATGEQWVEISA